MKSGGGVTPMMAQYLGIKEAHPGDLLFYRMGDFYELFFDDAVAAAAALEITLTKRGKHLGQDIAMCGVPVHSSESYLLTLIRKGFRVAICEQTEDPAEAKKRGGKSVVARAVTRVVTPGTLTEDSLLEPRRNNFLAAWTAIRGEGALAWADISTGEVTVAPCPAIRLGPELARLAPRELLVPEAEEQALRDIAREHGSALTTLPATAFDSAGGADRLCKAYGVASLDAFGSFARPEIAALAGLLDYLDLTQKGRLPRLAPPRREAPGAHLQIDAATRRNLELTHALSGGRDGSLLHAIDRTVTAAGGRLLERRLTAPLTDLAAIAARQDAVAHLIAQPDLRTSLRRTLTGLPDLDRALSRLSLDRGTPRDLGAIRDGMARAADLAAAIEGAPAILTEAADAMRGHDDLIGSLGAALVAEPPALLQNGGLIAPGHDADLDEARRLRDEGRGVIAGMQADYAKKAGIPSLKIRHNNVLGYFVETTATHAERMLAAPLSDTFRHRQTTANAVRFTTAELSDLESRILNAGARALEIERRHFADLTALVLSHAAAIGDAARAAASLDVAAALADLAAAEDWCRPRLDDSRAFAIEGGRHPVVERALRAQGAGPFIPNHCTLDRLWLVTGPNMAGKSTFLRQNALIALLAHMGAYVPAKDAHIGTVSQIFSRVGAADDLARGRSTFMVEMVETAAILNQAGDRALVILDEIGRGTATYDGLSIAWATLEHLHEVNGCRGLFATHYHEMTALADRLPSAQNATVAVKEWQDDVIFLHEVRKGTADRSYGVQVARLAGLPGAVLARARTVLAALEKGEIEGGRRAVIDDLPLFAAAPPPPPAPKADPLAERLADVAPDTLSPRDALNLIYELKALTGR